MKRLSLIVLFGICLMASSFTPAGPGPFWLDGVWQGEGFQLNTQTHWKIVLEVDHQRGDYQVRYPSLNCGGNWELVSADEQRAEFREKITEGYFRCVNLGTLIITRVTPNHVSYTFFSPYDGSLEAHSTLERVLAPDS